MTDIELNIDTSITIDNGIDIIKLGAILQHFTDSYLYVSTDKLYGVDEVTELVPVYESVSCQGGIFIVSREDIILYCYRRELANYLVLSSEEDKNEDSYEDSYEDSDMSDDTTDVSLQSRINGTKSIIEAIKMKRKNKYRVLNNNSKICDVMASALRNKIKSSKKLDNNSDHDNSDHVCDIDLCNKCIESKETVEIILPIIPRKQVDNVKLSSLPADLKDRLIDCCINMTEDTILERICYNGHDFTLRKDGNLYSVYDDDNYTYLPCLRNGLQGENSIAQFHVLKSIQPDNDLLSDILSEYTSCDFPVDDYQLVPMFIKNNRVIIKLFCAIDAKPIKWKNEKIKSLFAEEKEKEKDQKEKDQKEKDQKEKDQKEKDQKEAEEDDNISISYSDDGMSFGEKYDRYDK